ncbi:hypothetical protein C818_03307 [Lachnospiraceae bacterium MD308]|nr:hypothetical protein C818_03307 [Lachnospiraceae bacterium MD308]
MNLHITKSKNAESFYICKSYVKANGSTTSTIVRKLGTLEQLLPDYSDIGIVSIMAAVTRMSSFPSSAAPSAPYFYTQKFVMVLPKPK